ncbi:MAG: hypothetical protein M3440_04920 [Chloroflexota bacterium]|nr:hypothetical protein [Chloroflexota bacterium]
MTLSIVTGARIKHPRPVETVTGDLVTIHTPSIHGLADTTLVQRRLEPVYKVSGLRACVWRPESLAARVPSQRRPWQPVVVPDGLDSHEAVVAWLVTGIAADGAVANAA